MDSFLSYQTIESEFRYDVIGPEECVYLFVLREILVFGRIAVNDGYLLENQSRERLDMYLLEFNVSVKSVVKSADDLPGYICLDLGKLNCQYPCNDRRSNSYEAKPEYF